MANSQQFIHDFKNLIRPNRNCHSYADSSAETQFRGPIPTQDNKRNDKTTKPLKSDIMRRHSKEQQQEEESYQDTRDTIQIRLNNLVDHAEELKRKNSVLQSENVDKTSKIQDLKIQINELNKITSKINSIVNRDDHSGGLEKENQSLKETIQKVNEEKRRLQSELSLTINLLKSREECATVTKREEDTLCTFEPDMIRTEVDTNPTPNIRNISSDSNVYNFTAATVNIIKSSTVGLDKRLEISNQQSNINMQMEIEN